jgi:hypothetical protein
LEKGLARILRLIQHLASAPSRVMTAS